MPQCSWLCAHGGMGPQEPVLQPICSIANVEQTFTNLHYALFFLHMQCASLLGSSCPQLPPFFPISQKESPIPSAESPPPSSVGNVPSYQACAYINHISFLFLSDNMEQSSPSEGQMFSFQVSPKTWLLKKKSV